MITIGQLIVANIVVGGWCIFVLACAFIAAIRNSRN